MLNCYFLVQDVRKQFEEDLRLRKSSEQQPTDLHEFFPKQNVVDQLYSGKHGERNKKTETEQSELDDEQDKNDLLDDEPQDEAEIKERKRNARLFRAAKDGDVKEVMPQRSETRRIATPNFRLLHNL
jgi:hypothetical protein